MTALAGLVLAAGRGTRIAALSRWRAKPLFPVGNSTPFERAVRALRAAGATEIVANAAHRAQDVVVAGRALDVEVAVEEGGPFGTDACLDAARARTNADRIAIWNGDVVADVELSSLLRALDDDHEAIAALAVLRIGAPGTGNVGLDDEGRVVRLRQESFGRESKGAEFAAVHVVTRAAIDASPERGCLVGDLYLPSLRRGAKLRAVACVDRWHDVGDPESYLAANMEHAFVAHDVQIPREITVDRCCIGTGARVLGEGALREVVVWPSCEARAPLQRAIVVDGAEVVRVG